MDEIKYDPANGEIENIYKLIDAFNTMIREMNTGKIWDILVDIRRTEENIYNSLPVSVQAEMIEEEYNAALAELEEILK